MPLHANMGMKMFWAFGLVLALTLVPFLIVKLALHKSAWEVAGPYLALAVPQLIFLLVAGRLWKWEELGPSPRRLAFGWGLSMALFFLAICAAFFYSSVELRLVNLTDAVWVFGMMSVSGTPLGFFIPYKMTLARSSARVG